MAEELRPIIWVGASLRELRKMPEAVQDHIGFALHLAQTGCKHPDAKPLKGFGGASVLEVVSDYHGDTYRGVYTVRLARGVYVLHTFQKKSRQGIATPKADMDIIKQRLRDAETIDRGENT